MTASLEAGLGAEESGADPSTGGCVAGWAGVSDMVNEGCDWRRKQEASSKTVDCGGRWG